MMSVASLNVSAAAAASLGARGAPSLGALLGVVVRLAVLSGLRVRLALAGLALLLALLTGGAGGAAAAAGARGDLGEVSRLGLRLLLTGLGRGGVIALGLGCGALGGLLDLLGHLGIALGDGAAALMRLDGIDQQRLAHAASPRDAQLRGQRLSPEQCTLEKTY